jgi:peptidoglycan hydrolase-like protein with peptidoglycan-binding domain
MTSELNFEAMPFEYHGEVPQPFSNAYATENEEFEYGGQHHGGGHHHGGGYHQRHHHRRRRRFGAPHWPVSSVPIDDSPFDDGDDDDSQPPSDSAGDFEAEAEYRNRRGRSNWRRQHHGGGRHHSGQQSFPFDGLPFGAFDDSQSQDGGGFELEGETRLRDHRRDGANRRHVGAAASPWRERTWHTGTAPQWRQRGYIGAPSFSGAGHHRRWEGVGDSYWGRRWNVPNSPVHWPHFAKGRRWWPSPLPQEPYGGSTGADIGAPDPYSAGAGAAPSEYVRWAQAALNNLLGLQLPTNGIADPATRSAIRTFQQQNGLPADGVIGPDTERALIAARAVGSSSPGGAGSGAAGDGPAGGGAGMGGGPDAGGPAQSGAGGVADPNAGAGASQSPMSGPTAGAPATREFGFEWENYATVRSPPAAGCAPEPGEVAASHSEAGVLAKEVENTNRGILVADFGIDWRSVKARAKAELGPVVLMLETDPDVNEIWICGYTDCIGPGDAAYHKWLRTERARRVFNLLGPIARSKVKSVGPAPTDSYFAPNTDRVGRARNRSVLIVYKKIINMPPERISGTPCHKRFIAQAQQRLRSSPTMDSAVRARLLPAINTATAGGDESFIRPGSTSPTFAFHWSSITNYFVGLCNRLGGAAPSDLGLERNLIELDQDIINGRDAFNRERGTAYGYKKAMLDAEFSGRLDALMRNKAQTVYARY